MAMFQENEADLDKRVMTLSRPDMCGSARTTSDSFYARERAGARPYEAGR
jgi:hypothetical protein